MDDNHELFAPAAAEKVGGDAPAPAPARRAGVIDQKRGAANFLLVKQHAGGDYNPFGSMESSASLQSSLATDEAREAALAMMTVRGYLNPVEADSHLDCRDTGLNLHETKELAAELARDPDVTSIDLSGNMIGLLHPDGVPPPRPDDGHTYPALPGMEALADCFRENVALTRIDISRNSFGDLGQPSLVKLLDSFKHKKNIKILDLSANGLLGPEGNRFPGLAHFCLRVLSTTSLVHLDLTFNEIHAEAVKMLSNGISIPSLLCLDLSHNRVSEEPRGGYDPSGWNILMGRLQLNHTLTCLKVADNRLGNAECIELAKVAEQMMGLRCLDLRDNLIHAVGVSALANAFYDDEHLEVLDVSGNPITDVGGRHLAKLVKMNSYLRELEINRCGLGENTVRAMDKALYINTTLELLQAHENGLSRTKMQVLADAVQCNFELRDIWEDPVKYDLNARSPALVRLLLKKVHLLPSEQLHKLYSNKSVMANPDYEKLIVELAPPSRKHIILSGSAGMSKTLVAGEGKLKAALMIQRQWRFKKSGKKRVDFQEAVNIMIKAKKRELHNRFGYAGHAANKKMWADKKRKAKAKLLTAVKLGLTSKGPKVSPFGGLGGAGEGEDVPEAPVHQESGRNLNDFRLSDKDRELKKERVRKMSGKITSLW